jgi:hypothetical protein
MHPAGAPSTELTRPTRPFEVRPDGEKVTEVAEPAALRDMQILSVAG